MISATLRFMYLIYKIFKTTKLWLRTTFYADKSWNNWKSASANACLTSKWISVHEMHALHQCVVKILDCNRFGHSVFANLNCSWNYLVLSHLFCVGLFLHFPYEAHENPFSLLILWNVCSDVFEDDVCEYHIEPFCNWIPVLCFIHWTFRLVFHFV